MCNFTLILKRELTDEPKGKRPNNYPFRDGHSSAESRRRHKIHRHESFQRMVQEDRHRRNRVVTKDNRMHSNERKHDSIKMYTSKIYYRETNRKLEHNPNHKGGRRNPY